MDKVPRRAAGRALVQSGPASRRRVTLGSGYATGTGWLVGGSGRQFGSRGKDDGKIGSVALQVGRPRGISAESRQRGGGRKARQGEREVCGREIGNWGGVRPAHADSTREERRGFCLRMPTYLTPTSLRAARGHLKLNPSQGWLVVASTRRGSGGVRVVSGACNASLSCSKVLRLRMQAVRLGGGGDGLQERGVGAGGKNWEKEGREMMREKRVSFPRFCGQQNKTTPSKADGETTACLPLSR